MNTVSDKHCSALIAAIFQSLCIRSIRKNVKTCILISFHYCTRFNPLQSLSKLTLHLAVGGLHGLSQTQLHWSSHQPNSISTCLQPLSVQLKRF